MALSDTAWRNAKPQDTKYKLYKDGGLLIVVAPSLGKFWRFTYRLNGAEKQLSFGTYPVVTLKAARLRRDEARSLVGDGIVPGAEKKRKLTQAQTATILRIDQPKVSSIINGRLDGYSTDRLMRFLNDLGCDVQISVSPPRLDARGHLLMV